MINNSNDLSKYPAKKIFVRNLNRPYGMNRHDEYTDLIFISTGKQRIVDEEDDNSREDALLYDLLLGNEYSSCYPIYLQFMTIEEMEKWINNMHYLIDSDEELKKRLENEISINRYGVHSFSKICSLVVANATIKHAKMLIEGHQTKRLVFPSSVKKILDVDFDDYTYKCIYTDLEKIALLKPFDIASSHTNTDPYRSYKDTGNSI